MKRSVWIFGPALVAALFLSIGWMTDTGVPSSIAASPSAITDAMEVDTARAAAAEDATHRLRLEFKDQLTGGQTPVRVGVFDASGNAIAPSPPEDYLFQALGGGSFFYCDGYVELDVPDGFVTIRAGKGPEYDPVTFQVGIFGDAFYSLVMRHRIDMQSRGWFSGDTHTHMTHSPLNYTLTPEDMARVMAAEDLNFMNSMDHEIHFTGAPHALSTPDRILYFSREYGNPNFGHLSLLGLTNWISSVGGCPDTSWVACGRVLNSAIADEVHQQPGAMLIITHPFPTVEYEDIVSWPGGGVARGIPIDLVDGGFDAMDLICYTHQLPPEGIEEYTQALNAGFHVPASAGTDAILTLAASNPPGGYRVYTAAGDAPEDFNSQSWIDALKNGKSFVTNAPLFTTFTLDGHDVGATIATHASTLSGSVAVECRVPMERVEIIAEGRVIATLEPPVGGNGKEISGTFEVPADSVRWVAARATGAYEGWHVIGAPELFAQTSPIYIEYLDHSTEFVYPKQREAAFYFIARLGQMTALFDRIGYFPDNSRPTFDDAVERALNFYHGLVPDPASTFSYLEPTAWSNAHNCYATDTQTPTFVWTSSTDDDPGSSITYEITYSPDSLFLVDTVTETVADTSYTVPAEAALNQLERYFWKVTAVDDTGYRTGGTPAVMSFVVDVTGTAIRNRPLQFVWTLGPGRPNPFSANLLIDYSVADGGGEHVVDVVDVRGAVVRRLYAGKRPAGRYALGWDGSNQYGNRAVSGVYFLRLVSTARGTIATRKIVLVR